MTQADADYYVECMSDLERRVIVLCSLTGTYQYSRLAEMTDAPHGEVKRIGDRFKAMNLAIIKPTVSGGEFSGLGIFLNERGEKVRATVEKLSLENKNAEN